MVQVWCRVPRDGSHPTGGHGIYRYHTNYPTTCIYMDSTRVEFQLQTHASGPTAHFVQCTSQLCVRLVWACVCMIRRLTGYVCLYVNMVQGVIACSCRRRGTPSISMSKGTFATPTQVRLALHKTSS
jgi:hypothetical protein